MRLSIALDQGSKPTRQSRGPRATAVPLAEFEVPLPRDLHRFGKTTRASVCGPEQAPLIVVLGGISANRFPCLCPDGGAGWWSGLAGEDRAADARRYRILGIDFIADRNGQGAPTTKDQAAAVCSALDVLGVTQSRAVIGASYGGMTALSLGQHFPGRAEKLVVVSADAKPHPAATAIRELQRRVVALGLSNGGADEALSIARGLAMLTYRTPAEFEARFSGGNCDEDVLACSEPGAYLKARGDAFQKVMSPSRFLSLSASIDRHCVEPSEIALPVLLIGAETDQLVLPSQMRSLADRLGGKVDFHLLPSPYGHDMFLKDAARVSELVSPFLRSDR